MLQFGYSREKLSKASRLRPVDEERSRLEPHERFVLHELVGQFAVARIASRAGLCRAASWSS